MNETITLPKLKVLTALAQKASDEGITKFTGQRKPVTDDARLLKPSYNEKIGKFITVGDWAGMHIFTLTLEERATCPRSCHHWDSCYGNNMRYAHRFQHGDVLETRLEEELTALQATYKRTGFAVRLHVLGDFYSERYVALWGKWLKKFPALHVWGYTARHPGAEPIGDALETVRLANPKRFAMRYSNHEDASVPQALSGETAYTAARLNGRKSAANILTCPEQTGGKKDCASCGICWDPKAQDVAIAFVKH